MLSKKSMGIAGAAMLGTAALLGTNAAYAIKADGGDEAVTYAMESVVKTGALEEDGTMYYLLGTNIRWLRHWVLRPMVRK